MLFGLLFLVAEAFDKVHGGIYFSLLDVAKISEQTH